MSSETIQWLNTNTLIGQTDKRGKAWHYRADDQGDEPNHYPGFIPIEDVRRRLFHWHAEERQIFVQLPCEIDEMTGVNNDGMPVKMVQLADRKAIARSDNGHVMGLFKSGYLPHQYDAWLLDQVAALLDDDLGITSGGILKQGAIAWVEVSVPESITTPEGVIFRPNLLATTSFDGSIATTYKRCVTDVVCDNTRASALSEKGQTVKIYHTSGSKMRLAPAREALAMVHTLADDFAAEVAQLCATTVTEAQWGKFLDAWVEMPKEAGRGKTMAETKRAQLDGLWRHDNRCAPWQGTAHGVLQTVNTWSHHVMNIRKDTPRSERNMLRAVDGTTAAEDAAVFATLSKVLTGV